MSKYEDYLSSVENPQGTDSAEGEKAPDAPDYEALLKQERQEREALQAQLREKEAAFQARMDTLERVATNRPAAQPAAAPAPKDWTTEEIMQDPKGAFVDIASRIMQEGVGALNQQYAHLLSSVVEDTFDTKLETLDSKRFGKALKPYIQQYFNANPHLKLQRGALDQVYKTFVADHLDELLALEEDRKDRADVPPSKRPAEQPRRAATPVAPAPRLSLREEPETRKPHLSKDEEWVRGKFAKLGVDLSDAEFAAIRDGRLLANRPESEE